MARNLIIRSNTGADVYHSGVVIPPSARTFRVVETPNPDNPDEIDPAKAKELEEFALTASFGFPSKPALLLLDKESLEATRDMEQRMAEERQRVAAKVQEDYEQRMAEERQRVAAKVQEDYEQRMAEIERERKEALDELRRARAALDEKESELRRLQEVEREQPAPATQDTKRKK